MLSWLNDVRKILLETWLVRVLLGFWIAGCTYDQFSGFVSQLFGRELPTIISVLGAGVIPAWVWAFGFVFILLIALLEHAVRLERISKAEPLTDEALRRQIAVAQDVLAQALSRLENLESARRLTDEKVESGEQSFARQQEVIDTLSKRSDAHWTALAEAYRDIVHYTSANILIEKIQGEIDAAIAGRNLSDNALKDIRQCATELGRAYGRPFQESHMMAGFLAMAADKFGGDSANKEGQRLGNLLYWRQYTVTLSEDLNRRAVQRIMQLKALDTNRR